MTYLLSDPIKICKVRFSEVRCSLLETFTGFNLSPRVFENPADQQRIFDVLSQVCPGKAFALDVAEGFPQIAGICWDDNDSACHLISGVILRLNNRLGKSACDNLSLLSSRRRTVISTG